MFWFSVVPCYIFLLSEIPLSTFFELLSLCACGHLLHFPWDDRPALFSWALLLWLSSGHCSLGLEREGPLSSCPCCSQFHLCWLLVSLLPAALACLFLSGKWLLLPALALPLVITATWFLRYISCCTDSRILLPYFSLCVLFLFNKRVNAICVLRTVCSTMGMWKEAEADNRLSCSPFHLLRQGLPLESRAHKLSGWSYPSPELSCHSYLSLMWVLESLPLVPHSLCCGSTLCYWAISPVPHLL